MSIEAKHTLSPQQQDIIVEFREGDGHIVIRARAGTGKTYIIIAGVEVAPEENILVCAFSKIIEQELTKRVAHLNGRVKSKTLHAVGLGCVMRFWPGLKVGFGSERADDLAEKVCGATAPDPMKRLVAKLCTKGREIAPHATKLGDLTDIAYTFECDPDESWCNDGFDLDYVERKALDAMELAATVKPVVTGIDGADMIFLPVRNRWLRKSYDMVVVDEAQDMTMAQLEIAQGICRGRVVVVGDDRQAIFGFRGADSGSLDRLKGELDAHELGLTVTYRCGKRIVEYAQKLVPDFTAGPDNPEGAVTTLDFSKLTATAGPSDFILSRVNAPLVSVAMSLLRNGKRTRIAGRDIGAGLNRLVRKLKARSIPDMLNKISDWELREADRLTAKFKGKLESQTYLARMDAIHDQAEMLSALAQDAKSVDAMLNSIDALFSDDGLGAQGLITCSSIHRAKGLEANRVFVLTSTIRNDSQEEKNLAYVAYTRAKQELVLVTEAK